MRFGKLKYTWRIRALKNFKKDIVIHALKAQSQSSKKQKKLKITWLYTLQNVSIRRMKFPEHPVAFAIICFYGYELE